MKFERVDEYRYRIPAHKGMNVPGLIYASKELMNDIRSDSSAKQVVNVAHLPGIVGNALLKRGRIRALCHAQN